MKKAKEAHLVDAMVKLNADEIKSLAIEHTNVVEEITKSFDTNYLDLRRRIKDYREMLTEMDKNLKRAEELMEVLDAE